MKVAELLNEDYLSEAQSAEVGTFIDMFVTSLFEDDVPTPTDGSPASLPSSPPGSGQPAPGGPKDPGPHDSIAGLWFKTLVGQLWWLTSAQKIKKRLKQVGVSGEANKRITNSINIAQKNIGLLFQNPGWRPAPRFKLEPGKPPKPLNKSYMVPVNRAMHGILADELKKIPPHILHKALNEGWKSNIAQSVVAGAMVVGGVKAIQMDTAKNSPTWATIEGDYRTYLPANGNKPPYPSEVKTGMATINGKKVKIKYWSSGSIKSYKNHYYEVI